MENLNNDHPCSRSALLLIAPSLGSRAESAIPERCEPRAPAAPTVPGCRVDDACCDAASGRLRYDDLLGLAALEGLDDSHEADHGGEGWVTLET